MAPKSSFDSGTLHDPTWGLPVTCHNRTPTTTTVSHAGRGSPGSKQPPAGHSWALPASSEETHKASCCTWSLKGPTPAFPTPGAQGMSHTKGAFLPPGAAPVVKGVVRDPMCRAEAQPELSGSACSSSQHIQFSECSKSWEDNVDVEICGKHGN